jgi:hypothetical protein
MSELSGDTEASPTPDEVQDGANKKGSKMEHPASTSFETLCTIDMLNFKFVNSCEVLDDLRRVINLLAAQLDSPQLLQAARERLEHIQKKPPARTSKMSINCEDEDDSPGKIFFNGGAANISRITIGNTTLDSIEPSKSTLNFSLSPQSVLHGVDLIDAPTVQENMYGTSSFPDTKARLGPIAESTGRTPVAADNQKLSEEVKQLSTEAMDLETSRIADQESFVQKLEELEKAKQEAELLVKSLFGKVEKVDSQKQDLVEAMQKLQKEQRETRQGLENERSTLRKKDDEARVLEKRLQGKIAELTKALSSTTERSRLVMGAEKGLRLQREQDLSEQNRRNEDLNRMLHETHDNLEKLKRRHAQFRMELHRAIGASDSEVSEACF